MNKRILFATAAFTTFILFTMNGCSVKFNNKQFNKQVIDDINNSKKLSVVYKKFKNEQVKVDDKYIDLSVNKKLSTALNELSRIDNKVYLLDSSSDDILLRQVSPYASKLLKINSFNKLKKYIEETTDYTIKIVNNKFKNGIKRVQIFNKVELKTNFKKIPFTITGTISVADALQQIAKKTGFTIIYNYDFANYHDNSRMTLNSNNLQSYLSGEKIYFKGDSIEKFLSYMSITFNIYVDIDYKNKVIKLSKYKTKIFNLITPEYKVRVKNAMMGTSGDTTTTTNTSETVKDTINILVVSKFIESIKELINYDKNSKVLMNESGMVIVKTTKNNMDIIEKMFNKYNELYSQQIEIELDVYEFLLSKEFDIGTDFVYNGKKINFLTDYLTNNILSYSNNDSSVVKKALLNLNNNLIRFSKKYSFKKVCTNNIPESFNLINNKDYIKSITTTTTTGTSTTTNTSTEIGTITEGQILTILPRIYGNKVFIKTELKLNNKNGIETIPVGNTVILLPDITENKIPSTNILNFGDRVLIGFYQTYENANTYKGIAPIEGFIIGGSDGKKYVRKLIVVILSVKKP